ncbi:hypothetical protein [Nostoc sp.]
MASLPNWAFAIRDRYRLMAGTRSPTAGGYAIAPHLPKSLYPF